MRHPTLASPAQPLREDRVGDDTGTQDEALPPPEPYRILALKRVIPVLTSNPAIPQCERAPGSLPLEIDTSDTHFSDLTCPQGCLRVPFSTLQPKTFLGRISRGSIELAVLASVHAGLRENRDFESLPLRHYLHA